MARLLACETCPVYINKEGAHTSLARRSAPEKQCASADSRFISGPATDLVSSAVNCGPLAARAYCADATSTLVRDQTPRSPR